MVADLIIIAFYQFLFLCSFVLFSFDYCGTFWQGLVWLQFQGDNFVFFFLFFFLQFCNFFAIFMTYLTITNCKVIDQWLFSLSHSSPKFKKAITNNK